MPRYDNYGQKDTPFLSAGDTFFQTFNNRLRPDQLAAGQLAYSQNGRMDVDGAWQQRKGIESFGPVLSSNTAALTLPFYLYESEVVTAASRVNETVTITLANLGNDVRETATTGVHAVVNQNIVPAANSGYYTLSVYVKANTRTKLRFGSSSSVVAGTTTSLPTAEFELSGAGVVSSGTGTISSVGNGWYRVSVSQYMEWDGVTALSFGLYFLDGSGNLSYAGSTSNGFYISDWQLETATSASRYEPTSASAGSINLIPYGNTLSNGSWTKTRTTVSGTNVVGPGRFVDGSIIYLSDITGTEDPRGNRQITVVTGGQFTFTIPGASGSETYTLGASPAAGAPRLEANLNASYGSCLFSDPSDDSAEYIIEATYDKAVAISLVDGTSTDIDYPAGVTVSSEVRLLQTFDKVILFRDGATALEWDGDLTGSPAFTKVANGTYINYAYLNTSSNTVIADGVVTVSETGHGLSVGDRIYVIDNGSSTLVESDGGYVVATVPTANSFTFYANVADMSAHSVVYGKRGSIGRGFTHMPAPAWGVYHQRRLIVPFFYTTTGTSGSEVITSRDVRDEFLISDVFDSDTYDQLQNQFKVTAGIADYLQYIHPFTDDNAIAFNRNSIHLISGLNGSLADITIKEITREAGLVAQRSVVTIGNRIFFLSDNGVYSTDFGDLYNLRGAGLPLSDAIDPTIKRINSAYASGAVAIYHDNRYWLAVPLDGATRNNALLVYNLLNGGWESVDVIDDPSWDIANLIVAGAGGVNQLYAINRFGGIHILDYRDDDVDRLALYPGQSATSYPVDSYSLTRQYTGGSPGRKKWNSFEMHVQSSDSNASNASLQIVTENTDEETTLGTLSGYLSGVLPESEDASVRGRMGNIRAYGLQVKLVPTQGRPKLRMVQTNSIPAFNSLISVS